MFNTRLLLIAIVIVLIPTTVSAITVQGTVYEWSTFEPLDDALVEEFPDEDIGNVTYDVEDNILPGFDLTYTAVALFILMIMVAAAYYYYKRNDGMEKESEPIELTESTESTEPTTSAEPAPAPGVHSENDYPDDR